jgi:2-methylcitrate dehydratase
VYGAVSTSAAAGWLWGLRDEQLAHAISLGTIANIAMRQTRVGELSHWKGCAFANAARNGVFGADLARRGMTGPDAIFTGAMGLFNQVSGPLEITLPTGDDFMILRTYIKYWPAEYHSQSAIDAALKLRPAIGDPAEIERIDIDSFDAAVDIIGSEPEKWQPTSRETADHSMPYCVAVALWDGDVNLASFADERIADPRLRALIQRVSIHRDEEMNRGYPAGIPNRLRIRLRDGRELSETVAFPPGHAKNPLSDTQVREKYARTAATVLPPGRRTAVHDLVLRLEELPSLDPLLGELKP